MKLAKLLSKITEKKSDTWKRDTLTASTTEHFELVKLFVMMTLWDTNALTESTDAVKHYLSWNYQEAVNWRVGHKTCHISKIVFAKKNVKNFSRRLLYYILPEQLVTWRLKLNKMEVTQGTFFILFFLTYSCKKMQPMWQF